MICPTCGTQTNGVCEACRLADEREADYPATMAGWIDQIEAAEWLEAERE